MLMKYINLKIFFVLSLILNQSNIYAQSYGGWKISDSLNTARAKHTATLLPNGNILVVGGSGKPLTTCEIYDTSSKKWRYTGSMKIGRSGHKSVLLPNGKVLVTGGYVTTSCELFDPVTETWTAADSNKIIRTSGQTATLLKNGDVLIAGGIQYIEETSQMNIIKECELYNPQTNNWTVCDSLITARYGHTATLLPDGRVLVAGGYNNKGHFLRSCEIFDPVAGTWQAADSLMTGRNGHSATLLEDRRLLVAGGRNDTSLALKDCEAYDPLNNKWTTLSPLNYYRCYHKALLLPGGLIMFMGGSINFENWELYDPVAGKSIYTGSVPVPKEDAEAILYSDGKVMSIGGYIWTQDNSYYYPTKICEIYDPLITAIISRKEIFNDFELFQNYPNPFNSETNIVFKIPFTSMISLEIYNCLGQTIETIIFNREYKQGKYSIKFNGDHISSGVYYYKLKCNSLSRFGKMVIIK